MFQTASMVAHTLAGDWRSTCIIDCFGGFGLCFEANERRFAHDQEERFGALIPDLSMAELEAGLIDDDIKDLGRQLGVHYAGDPGYPYSEDPHFKKRKKGIS